MACPPGAARQLALPLRDGGVRLQQERDGGIMVLPETGNEAVL
jgi:hypothetical protein